MNLGNQKSQKDELMGRYYCFTCISLFEISGTKSYNDKILSVIDEREEVSAQNASPRDSYKVSLNEIFLQSKFSWVVQKFEIQSLITACLNINTTNTSTGGWTERRHRKCNKEHLSKVSIQSSTLQCHMPQNFHLIKSESLRSNHAHMSILDNASYFIMILHDGAWAQKSQYWIVSV